MNEHERIWRLIESRVKGLRKYHLPRLGVSHLPATLPQHFNCRSVPASDPKKLTDLAVNIFLEILREPQAPKPIDEFGPFVQPGPSSAPGSWEALEGILGEEAVKKMREPKDE